MSKELEQLQAQLATKKTEAQALLSNPNATAEEMSTKKNEIQALNAKIALQKQNESDEGAGSAAKADGSGDDGYKNSVVTIKKQYPGVLDQFENEIRADERQRIQDIDAIAGQIAPDLVNKAKYKTPMLAKDLAFEAIKNQRVKGEKFLNDFTDDTKTSNVKDVGAAPGGLSDETDDQQRASIGQKLADAANKLIGR